MEGSTTAVSEILVSQDTQHERAKEMKKDFELRSTEHASNIIDILRRNGYTPNGKKEMIEYEKMYQSVYTEAVAPKSLAALLSSIVNQTDAAIDYTVKIDSMRFELIQKIESETKHLLDEARTDVPTFVRYAEIIEEYTTTIIKIIREYGELSDDEAIKIVPNTVNVKVDRNTVGAMSEALIDSLRRIHNFTIMKIIGMEDEYHE